LANKPFFQLTKPVN